MRNFSFAELFGFDEPEKYDKNFYGGIVHTLGVDMVISSIDGHAVSRVAFIALGVLVLLFVLLCGIRAAYPSAMPASVVLVGIQLDEGAPMDWWIPTGVLLCGLVVMAAILFHRQHGTDSLMSAIVFVDRRSAVRAVCVPRDTHPQRQLRLAARVHVVCCLLRRDRGFAPQRLHVGAIPQVL